MRAIRPRTFDEAASGVLLGNGQRGRCFWNYTNRMAPRYVRPTRQAAVEIQCWPRSTVVLGRQAGMFAEAELAVVLLELVPNMFHTARMGRNCLVRRDHSARESVKRVPRP